MVPAYEAKVEEFKKRTTETAQINKELNDDNFGKRSEKKPFRDLIKGFSGDIAELRTKKVQYDNLKLKNNSDEIELLQWMGKNILEKSDDIASQILLQMEATTDPYDKADLANLELELDKIRKNVTGLAEKKVVNG